MPISKGCGPKIEWILVDGARIPLDTRKHPIYTRQMTGSWVTRPPGPHQSLRHLPGRKSIQRI